MKKRFYLLALLFFAAQSLSASAIDHIRDASDVNKFIRRNINSDATDIVAPEDTDTATFGANRFYKLDLNNDGRTDLLINGRECIAIIDKGKGKYQVCAFNKGYFADHSPSLVCVLTTQQMPVLVLERKKRLNYTDSITTTNDTVTYRFGDFVELNNNPEPLIVDSLLFSNSGCFGSCPVFEFKLSQNGAVLYDAEEYNTTSGRFSGIVPDSILREILSLTTYVRPSALQNSYHVNWTDDETATLTLVFHDGSRKTITDYGEIATMGLSCLYRHFFDLRTEVSWQPVTIKPGSDTYPITRDTTGDFPDSLNIAAQLAEYCLGTGCGIMCSCGGLKLRICGTPKNYGYHFVYVAVPCMNVLERKLITRATWRLIKIAHDDSSCYWQPGVTLDSDGLPFYTLADADNPIEQ